LNYITAVKAVGLAVDAGGCGPGLPIIGPAWLANHRSLKLALASPHTEMASAPFLDDGRIAFENNSVETAILQGRTFAGHDAGAENCAGVARSTPLTSTHT